MSDHQFVVDMPGGFRAGGTNYLPGQLAPIKYRQQLNVDPTSGTSMPSNFGKTVIPHIYTFGGLVSSLAKVYRNADQAILHNVQNAAAMLNDPVISGPLQARQRMVSLLNWSIEPEDKHDKQLLQAAAHLTRLVSKTYRFTEYLRVLSEAIWYGKYAILHSAARSHDRAGKPQWHINKWMPINGDKLVFRFDDNSGSYDPDGVGIKVSMSHLNRNNEGGLYHNLKADLTPDGPAVFFDGWERRRIIVHKHMIRDGEYEDPVSAGYVQGVGIRNFLYWTWYQKQETLAQLVEIVERTAMGFTIYYYPTGNYTYKQEIEKVAAQQGKTNVILAPYDPAMPQMPTVEQIPMNTAGMQALQNLIDNYFGDMITRFILGQTLSTKAAGGGIGNSGVADLQHDSLKQIVRSDSAALEETVTREKVDVLRDWNYPQYRNVPFYFRLNPESTIPQQELMAMKAAWDMGAELNGAEVLARLGLNAPGRGDLKLFNPAIVAQKLQLKQQEQVMQQGGNQMPPGTQLPGQGPDGGPSGGPPNDSGPEGPGGGDPETDPNHPDHDPHGIDEQYDQFEGHPRYRKGKQPERYVQEPSESKIGLPAKPPKIDLPEPGAEAEVKGGIDPQPGSSRISDSGGQETLQGGRWKADDSKPAPELKPGAPAGQKPSNLTRNYIAGMNHGTVQFENPLHRDLHDYASAAKMTRLASGKTDQKSQGQHAIQVAKLRDKLVAEHGLPEEELLHHAKAVHDSVKEQMKGMQHGEVRQVKMPKLKKVKPAEASVEAPNMQAWAAARKSAAPVQKQSGESSVSSDENIQSQPQAEPKQDPAPVEPQQPQVDQPKPVEPQDEKQVDDGHRPMLKRRELHNDMVHRGYAPFGGVTLAGKQFEYGQLIPRKEFEEASNEERQAYLEANNDPARKFDFKNHIASKEQRSVLPTNLVAQSPTKGSYTHLGNDTWKSDQNGMKVNGNTLFGKGGDFSFSDEGYDPQTIEKHAANVSQAMEQRKQQEAAAEAARVEQEKAKKIDEHKAIWSKQANAATKLNKKQAETVLLQMQLGNPPQEKKMAPGSSSLIQLAWERGHRDAGSVMKADELAHAMKSQFTHPGEMTDWLTSEKGQQVVDQMFPHKAGDAAPVDIQQQPVAQESLRMSDVKGKLDALPDGAEIDGVKKQHGKFWIEGSQIPADAGQVIKHLGGNVGDWQKRLEAVSQKQSLDAEQAKTVVPQDEQALTEVPQDESVDAPAPDSQSPQSPEPMLTQEQQAKPTQPAAPQQSPTGSKPDILHVRSMPVGTKIGDWEKIHDKTTGITAWENRQIPDLVNDDDFGSKVDPKLFQEAVDWHQKNPTGVPGQQPEDKATTMKIPPGTMRKINKVAVAFGFNERNLHNQNAVGNFIRQTAHHLGLNMRGASKEEQTIAAGKFLHQQTERLDKLSAAAINLGWQPNPAHSRYVQSTKAAQHILQTAMKRGFKPPYTMSVLKEHLVRGDKKAMKMYQESLVASLNHLSEQKSTKGWYDSLADAVGGKRNLLILAGLLAVMWVMSSHMHHRRRR